MLEKLARQTAIYGISSIVVRMLNYLLTPYFTRIFTDAEYGVITDMYALIPFALVVLTMGMESGYFRFAGQAQGERERTRVFATTWGATILAALLFFAAAALFDGPIARATGYADHPSYVWIVAAIIALDVISAIPYARLREQGRAKLFMGMRALNVTINVILCFVFGLLGLYDSDFGVGYVFVANLAASALTLAAIVPFCGGTIPRVEWRTFRRILLYSLPLLLSGIAGTANEFIDRQLIKYLLPAGEAMGQLGIYGAVVKVAGVMLLFTQIYRMGAEPFFLASFRKEDFVQANAAALKYYMIVSVLIFLGIALFPDLFGLIVGPDFRSGLFILPVVLGANVLSGVVLNLSFWYKQTGRTIFAIVVTGTGLLFTLSLGMLLIPRLGYYGAAWARLLCEGAMVAVSYALNRRYFRTPYPMRRIGEYVLLGAALFCVGLLTERLAPLPHYALNAALLVLFVLYALRREGIDPGAMLRAAYKTKPNGTDG